MDCWFFGVICNLGPSIVPRVNTSSESAKENERISRLFLEIVQLSFLITYKNVFNSNSAKTYYGRNLGTNLPPNQ
jgi:hypothetical protein